MSNHDYPPTTRMPAILSSRTSSPLISARGTQAAVASAVSGSRRPEAAARPRKDLMVARTLLWRLRREAGADLPVHAAVPETKVRAAPPAAGPLGQTVRIPPIARTTQTSGGAPVVVQDQSAFDQALDRLLDELMAEPDPGPTADRPAGRVG